MQKRSNRANNLFEVLASCTYMVQSRRSNTVFDGGCAYLRTTERLKLDPIALLAESITLDSGTSDYFYSRISVEGHLCLSKLPHPQTELFEELDTFDFVLHGPFYRYLERFVDKKLSSQAFEYLQDRGYFYGQTPKLMYQPLVLETMDELKSFNLSEMYEQIPDDNYGEFLSTLQIDQGEV
jgi:hypothetical protein